MWGLGSKAWIIIVAIGCALIVVLAIAVIILVVRQCQLYRRSVAEKRYTGTYDVTTAYDNPIAVIGGAHVAYQPPAVKPVNSGSGGGLGHVHPSAPDLESPTERENGRKANGAGMTAAATTAAAAADGGSDATATGPVDPKHTHHMDYYKAV
jgi:hypothetical protein